MSLSAEQLAQFRSQGFLFPVRAFDSQQAELYRTRLREFQQRAGRSLHRTWQFKSHLFLQWVDEIVRLPTLLDAVESVIGPDILCWSSGFFIKPPCSRNHVGWHQDMEFWGLSPVDDVVTAWVALSDVRLDSGPVQYMPKSHFRPLPHVKTQDAGNTLYFKQKLAVSVDELSAVSATVSAGEATVHHPLVVHRSGHNLSKEPRIALAVRFISARVKGVGRQSASLVRGTDSFGHFEHEPRPKADFDVEAMFVHRRAMALQAARVR